jgi:hypothetical protein
MTFSDLLHYIFADLHIHRIYNLCITTDAVKCMFCKLYTLMCHTNVLNKDTTIQAKLCPTNRVGVTFIYSCFLCLNSRTSAI